MGITILFLLVGMAGIYHIYIHRLVPFTTTLWIYIDIIMFRLFKIAKASESTYNSTMPEQISACY